MDRSTFNPCNKMKVFVIFKHNFLNETDDVTEQYTANSASAKLSLL